jgi:N-methylhydantoinase B
VEGFINVELQPGEYIRGRDCGGGGYGSPLERDTARVLHDVRERWVSEEQAETVYGVVLIRDAKGQVSGVDAAATETRRAALAQDLVH